MTTRGRPGHEAREAASSPDGILALVERKLGLTSTGLTVLAVAAGTFVLGRALSNRGLLIVVYGLLFVVGVSWLTGRRKLQVDAERSELPSRVRPGQTVEAELTLLAKQRLATVILEETLHPHLGTSVRVPVPLLPSGEAVQHGYEFSPRLRGVYEVGPMVLEWSDAFALTRRRQVIAPAQTVVVHPRVESVVDRIVSRAWEDPPIRPPMSKPWPTGSEFYGMREYQHGDDPRRIVWRALAQYDEYLVRESEQGITDRINILLDTDRDVHSPGAVSETFEAAVSVVASLVGSHLKDGMGTTVECNSAPLFESLRGEDKTIRVLDQLAGVEREAERLGSALERLVGRMPRGAHNVVVTPHVTADTARRMRVIAEGGASVLLVLILWDDTDPGTVHRAGLIGCNVAEVNPNQALGPVFQNIVGGRVR